MFDSVPLDDPSEIPQAARLRLEHDQRWLLVSVLALMLSMAVVDLLSAPLQVIPFMVLCTLAIAVLCLWWAVRRKGYRWRAGVLVLAVLLVGTFSAVHHGSVRAAPVFAYIAAVVIAGTYLRRWALMAAAAAGLLLLAALIRAEVLGWLPQADMAADVQFWSTNSGILFVMGVALVNARRVMEQAYLRRLGQIEERMRLEQERDQSGRRFRRLFHINPTALVIQVAASRTVTEVNPAFERLMGRPLDAVRGCSGGALWADQPAWDRHCRRLFSVGHTGWEQATWLQADGHPRRLWVSSELIEGAGGPLVLTTAMDRSPGEAINPG
jgi:PAS domain-containing protein